MRCGDLHFRGCRNEEDGADHKVRRHPGPRRVLGGEDRGDPVGLQQVRRGGESAQQDLELRQQGEAAQGAQLLEDDLQRANQTRLLGDRGVPPEEPVRRDDAFSG